MARVYIDSCVFIEAFESATPTESRHLLDEIFARSNVRAVTSELSIAELLAPTKRALAIRLKRRREIYTSLFDDGDFIDLISISREILLETATLRLAFPQRLPDAIHMATALLHRCCFFISFDQDARRLPAPLTWITPTTNEINNLFKALDA